MIDFDLIHPEDPIRAIASKKLKAEIEFASLRESKAYAAFCGCAVGDSLGCFIEYVMVNYERNYITGFENIEEVVKRGEAPEMRCKKG